MEKYLGIHCNSNVKIRDYEKTVNHFSFEKTTDDLFQNLPK